MSAYLDTHVAVWLHDGLLELRRLHDRKRIGVAPLPLYDYLQATFGVGLCGFPFPAITMEALSTGWTNDPFDRIIVAQAKANREALLITADTLIRQNYGSAVW